MINEDVKKILDDPRPIRKIWLSGPEPDFYEIGRDGVTKIEPYGEPCEFCFIPWFAIYMGEVIGRRINATSVSEVVYKKEEKKDDSQSPS